MTSSTIQASVPPVRRPLATLQTNGTPPLDPARTALASKAATIASNKANIPTTTPATRPLPRPPVQVKVMATSLLNKTETASAGLSTHLSSESTQKASHSATVALTKTNTPHFVPVAPTTQPSLQTSTALSAQHESLSKANGPHIQAAVKTAARQATAPALQQLALQPMTQVQTSSVSMCKTDAPHSSSQSAQQAKSSTVKSTALSKQEMLTYLLGEKQSKGKVDPKNVVQGVTAGIITLSDCVSAGLITQKQADFLRQKTEVSNKNTGALVSTAVVQPSTNTATSSTDQAAEQALIAFSKLPKDQILLPLLDKKKSGEAVQAWECEGVVRTGKVSLQDLVHEGIITLTQAIKLYNYFVTFLPASLLAKDAAFIAAATSTTLTSASSSAVSSSRTSASAITSKSNVRASLSAAIKAVPDNRQNVEAILDTIKGPEEITESINLFYLKPTKTYVVTDTSGTALLSSLPPNSKFPDDVEFILLTDEEMVTFTQELKAQLLKVARSKKN